VSFGAIGLTDGFLCLIARALGAHLRAHDRAAPDTSRDLVLMAGHYSANAQDKQSARACVGTHQSPQRSVNMKYRGVDYSVVRGSTPDVWRWSVLVGQPEMLRLGDAATEEQADMQVRKVIDRALDVVEVLQFLDPKQND
jgi:hypothetical protein